MASRTIVCPDCGETVPSGHLTCPACGAMLASVSGGSIRPSTSVGDGAPVVRIENDDPSALTPARIESQVLPEASPDVPAPPAVRGPAIPLAPSSIRQTQIDGSGPMEAPAEAPMTTLLPTDGGYLPPGTPPSPATLPGPPPSVPVGPDVPSAAAGTNPITSEPSSPAWDVARMDQAIGYATAAGSGLIAFGMFMPWSAAVIGASGVEGLFNTWGLASPGFVLVLLYALAVLAVSVVPNGIPVAIRSGSAGLILGVLSLGLVWPYIFPGSPLGAGIGVMVVTVGAIVLTATGIASAWRDRHAADDRSV